MTRTSTTFLASVFAVATAGLALPCEARQMVERTVLVPLDDNGQDANGMLVARRRVFIADDALEHSGGRNATQDDGDATGLSVLVVEPGRNARGETTFRTESVHRDAPMPARLAPEWVPSPG